MKNIFFKSFILLSVITITFSSCLKDLDRSPFYGLNTASVYEDPANYIHVLAKLYSGLSTTGNQGPAGKPDLNPTVIDEGFSQYIRVLFNLEELPTDAAVCGWNDPGIPELHQMKWSADNYWVAGMYYRIYFQIPLCNEFIRESADGKMSDRGFSDGDQATIRIYRAEARFLRALSYYHAMDLFGNVPFIDENQAPGAFFPEQKSRADLFTWIESELKAIEPDLMAARTNEYGRADQAGAQFLLAKLYLNAQVYTGTPRYTDCITYCNKVISSGYTLQPKYADLFKADNNLSPEIIFPVTFDGVNTQTWGGTTFLVHCPVGGTMVPADFGIAGGWSGYRATSAYVNQFTDTLDGRNMFYKSGQNLNITSISTFTDGYPIAKWKNVTSTGQAGSDPGKTQVDTDFPMFRLADAYLMYAEAVIRGGGGDMGTATGYVNALRERAYGNASGDVTSGDLTPDFILSERAKELEWECQRRTDLIRFGKFTGGSYIWPWKGGVEAGTSVSDNLNLYPIPSSDIIANPHLVQNPGY